MRRRGRPPRIAGETASERVWAWLTPSERRSLERCALETHTELSVIIREAINEYVADFSEQKVFSVTGNSRPSVS